MYGMPVKEQGACRIICTKQSEAVLEGSHMHEASCSSHTDHDLKLHMYVADI